MKVLLITPPEKNRTVLSRKCIVPSLGLAYIAAYIDKYNFSVEIIDCRVNNISLKLLINKIKNYNPDIIGISFSTENRFDAFETVSVIKKNLPEKLIIAGGAHPTLATEDTLEKIKDIDIIVRGEGEHVFLDLLKCIEDGNNLSSVNNISYRLNNKIIHNPKIIYNYELDDLPFPAYDKLNMNKFYYVSEYIPRIYYNKTFPIITSRGCPYRCSFCATSEIWGHKIRYRSPDNVTKEMFLLEKNYGKTVFWIIDDSFTQNIERVEEICDILIASKKDYKLIIQGARINKVNEMLFNKLKKAGAVSISFGVESGSQNIIDNVLNKKNSVAMVENVSAMCKKTRLRGDFGFIIGHPGETEKEANDTLILMKKIINDGNTVNINLMKIYPGTELESIAKKEHKLPKKISWTDINISDSIISRSVKGNAPFYYGNMSETEVLKSFSSSIKLYNYLSSFTRLFMITCVNYFQR